MVGKLDSLEDFLVNQPAQIDISYFIISLLIAALLGFILSKLYVKYGTSISNRRKFSKNFVLLIVTTTLIITIVKSSLALSLGLVGALSIVRFRAAIKEPEELIFLFFAIAIGLGLGANQIGITLIAFFIVSLLIWSRHFYYQKEENQNLYLSVSGIVSDRLNLKNIVEILKKYCNSVHLKRFDKSQEMIEAAFLVDIGSINKLEEIKEELNRLSKTINITYLDKISIG